MPKNVDRTSAVGQRLGQLRAERHLSQAAFAALLDISLRSYQNYERNDRELPARVLLTLYQRLAVDPMWVMSGTDNGPGDPQVVDDPTLIQHIVAAVDRKLKSDGRVLDSDKLGLLVKHLYIHSRERGRLDECHLEEMLSLTV